MNLVFEGLVRSTADGKSIEPCLATSWDISDDGLVYTFHLREDVKFSDGTPVTAEDWEYSLERSLELGAWNSLISSIDDVKAVDEKTIDIVLKNIVKTYYVESLDHLSTSSIGTGRRTSRVDQAGMLTHGGGYASALDGVFHAPFLVAIAP